jgi:ADP-dependent NAD(P)H-hydrate dehydratase / NAD(P)H-hydrate epimerase
MSSLPDISPLFAGGAVRDADARAIASGIPGERLMETAGLAAAREILLSFPAGSPATVLVGPGNNGGDGMVVARLLAEAGWDVRVQAPGARPPATPDAARMTDRAADAGIEVSDVDLQALRAGGRVVVDALLGTGTRGAPRGAMADVVDAVCHSGAPVAALDIPTGVDADTGAAPGPAVRADLTITFAAPKVGLHVSPGRGHAGRVVVVDIGVPRDIAPAPSAWLAGDGVVEGIPPRGGDADKYRAGGVLVVGGAPGMGGAVRLSSRAALRTGAGIVVACVPRSVREEVASGTAEVMVQGAAGDDGLTADALDAVMIQAARVGTVAIGPGMGRSAEAAPLVRALLAAIAHPVVLDADGLWHLGDDLAALRARPGPTVITPHAGEAARLLGVPRAEVEHGRLAAARELCARSGAVALLKGPGTIIQAPGALPVVIAGGTQALATAGSGDVLTGVIAALIARGMLPADAATAGAALHARAGDAAGKGDGTIAGDIIEALPAALAGARQESGA